MLIDHGIYPENLPSVEDVKKTKRKLDIEGKKVLKHIKKSKDIGKK